MEAASPAMSPLIVGVGGLKKIDFNCTSGKPAQWTHFNKNSSMLGVNTRTTRQTVRAVASVSEITVPKKNVFQVQNPIQTVSVNQVEVAAQQLYLALFISVEMGNLDTARKIARAMEQLANGEMAQTARMQMFIFSAAVIINVVGMNTTMKITAKS